MNKLSDPKRVRIWTDPPAATDAPVAGYDEWLADDIAHGIADLDSGKATPLDGEPDDARPHARAAASTPGMTRRPAGGRSAMPVGPKPR